MSQPLLEAVLLRLARRRGVTAGTDAGQSPANLRLVGDLERVSGLGTVMPGTSLLVFGPDGAVDLRPAGSVVAPALRPGAAPTYLVVNHHPVSLDLTLGPLPTVDGWVLDRVVLRLSVQLVEPPSGLRELAREHGADLEAALLDQLSREVTSQVASAVRMNRLVDLERLSLSAVLEDGWLSVVFLGGLLAREAVQVTDVGWPTAVVGAGVPRGYRPPREP